MSNKMPPDWVRSIAAKDARIAELTAEVEELRYDLGVAKELIDDEKREVAKYKAPLEQFMAQWESDIQFYNGLDGNDLASWAELFRNALKDGV